MQALRLLRLRCAGLPAHTHTQPFSSVRPAAAAFTHRQQQQLPACVHKPPAAAMPVHTLAAGRSSGRHQQLAVLTAAALAAACAGGAVLLPVAHAEAGTLDDVADVAEGGAGRQQQPDASISGTDGPWVTDPELQMQLHRRALADNRLRGYIRLKEQELNNWLRQMEQMGVKITPEAFEHHMLQLEQEVNLQTSLILYQVPSATARAEFLAAYGCTKPTEEALFVIARFAPIIEIGAGLGHWQKALEDRGVKVVAVDNRSALPMPDVRTKRPHFVGKVVHGDEREVSKHPKSTLLLVYPGPDAMAHNALQRYRGQVLLYVGESRGGVNANPDFFDALEKEWELESVHPVEPFPNGMEKLWVLRRKKKAGWLW